MDSPVTAETLPSIKTEQLKVLRRGMNMEMHGVPMYRSRKSYGSLIKELLGLPRNTPRDKALAKFDEYILSREVA